MSSSDPTVIDHIAKHIAAFRWPARPWDRLSPSSHSLARRAARAALVELHVPVEKGSRDAQALRRPVPEPAASVRIVP